MGDGPLWAVAGALIAGLFTLMVQKLRGQTDETVAVLGQWQELLNAHKASAEAEIRTLKERVSSLEKLIAELRDQASKDMAALREQHATEQADMRQKHRAEMKAMRDLNEGLQRMIAQNSKSSAHLMGDSPVTPALKKSFPPEGDGK